MIHKTFKHIRCLYDGERDFWLVKNEKLRKVTGIYPHSPTFVSEMLKSGFTRGYLPEVQLTTSR